MFDIANVRFGEVQSTCSGDEPWQDVPQKILICCHLFQTTSHAFKRMKEMSLLPEDCFSTCETRSSRKRKESANEKLGGSCCDILTVQKEFERKKLEKTKHQKRENAQKFYINTQMKKSGRLVCGEIFYNNKPGEK